MNQHGETDMGDVWDWCQRDLRGRPRWAWILCAALLVGALAWWGWAGLAGLPFAALALLRGSRWVQPREQTPEAAHARAVRVSEQADARREVLVREERAAAESIEDAARHAAEDPLDEVDARIRREAGERRR